jgi:molybdopterin-guanine dinucleotide biosynthesis protein A
MAGSEPTSEVAGYVLAGGKSSRMGTDKALLRLGGKPLIEHAVTKLRRICSDVHILSSNSKLSLYAPLVPDLHAGCGPLGGIEAALAHSTHPWNLFFPVDLPFVPSAFLNDWVRTIVNRRGMRIRIALFSVLGVPQPTLLLIHRDAVSHIARAVSRGEFKLFPVLQTAALELALPDAPASEQVPFMLPIDEHFIYGGWQEPHPGPSWQILTAAQRAAQPFWFANLNTPQDFAEAEANISALDT